MLKELILFISMSAAVFAAATYFASANAPLCRHGSIENLLTNCELKP